MDLESGQPESHVVLELGSEPLLDDVVATLHVQILEGHRVTTEQVVGVGGHKVHPANQMYNYFKGYKTMKLGPKTYLS